MSNDRATSTPFTKGLGFFVVLGIALLIILGIYLAVAPYRARDFVEWLFQTQGRPKLIGGLVIAYGLMLSIAVFTY